MRDLRAILNKTSANMEKVVRGAVFRTGAQIESKSPVDKGTFRANWMSGVNGIDLSTTNSVSRSSTNELRDELGGFKMGNTFFYTNNLPYARMLEMGGSDQAPSGMVRLAVRNIQRYVNQEIAQL